MASTTSRTSTTPLVIGGVVVLLLALGFALLGGGDDDGPSGFDPADVAAPVIDGGAIAPGATDVQAPTVLADALLSEGQLDLPKEGEGTMIVFLAHWCPFCNAEVPVINEWLSEYGLPEGTELRAVATGIDPTQPNYPPDEWFRDFGWTVPTLTDIDGSIGAAYGVDGYPRWVFVDADGMVVGSSGPLTAPDMTEIAGSLAGGWPLPAS
jgi:thiol-disulfide isomerase/thioredoxin